ncbi:WxcM-like domain-containing protein [Scleromatobacter humisilvae]|uniref:WxcM-like domain-containing protein n=1 Tax=Scleromatobacter humisilvae TaxID=2897159 RepID=A0A9X1YP17_9BURK|nr:WxcM-like domain-containing protein [Scleromatobacter humisilvae]MCK9688348.1 WxcM-like domain-containing protein [Scleromatobacter humisilvae]
MTDRDVAATIDPQAVIDPHAVIENGCVVGARCIVRSGAHLGAGAWLDSDVVVGPNATLEAAGTDFDTSRVRVHSGVRIGANATICAGATLADRCEIRPGAVVTRSVPSCAIVEGNPATIIGYVDTEFDNLPRSTTAGRRAASVEQTPVKGVTVHRFPIHPDLRGNLTVGEFDRQVPFTPLRFFMVFGVPSREIRGEHAHLACHQFLICVEGSCALVADDGNKRFEVLLDDPSLGVYLPPMTWGIQYKYSADAKLLVFASHHYDSADYIRDYRQYLQLVARRDGAGTTSTTAQELP